MNGELTAQERALLDAWEARCRAGCFSPAVAATREVRVFGRAGDVLLHFPRITSLAALDELQPDERFAVEYARRVVHAHQRAGRVALAVRPAAAGGAVSASPQGAGGALLQSFDPTQDFGIVILSQIRGG
jgi:hypothetical protein